MRGAVINASPLETRQVFKPEPSVPGAGGDNNCSGRHPLTVLGLYYIRPPVTSDAVCGFGDKHLRSKFLCLCIGPTRKILPGDAGRKTEIVLDLRTRTGLP